MLTALFLSNSRALKRAVISEYPESHGKHAGNCKEYDNVIMTSPTKTR